MGVNKRGYVHRIDEANRKGGSRAMGFAALSTERILELRLQGIASTKSRIAAKNALPTKTCTKCEVEKSRSEFHQDKQKTDGLRPICKVCTNEQCLVYTRAHEQQNRDRANAYREKNAELVRQKKAQDRANNPEKYRQRGSEYRANNKEKCLVHSTNRRARKRGAEGAVSRDIIPKLLALQKGKCPCCGKPLGKDFHLDHIIPLIAGGTNADSNMQLLRAKCNLQKNRKDPVDFMQQRGFLL